MQTATPSQLKLVLFDIDGTLIDTGGAGMKALQQACLEEFGKESPQLDLAGSTDSGIVQGIFHALDIPLEESRYNAYLACYLKHLRNNLRNDAFHGRVLPHVREAIAWFQSHEISLGLLTGNIAAGSDAKLLHYQLLEFFPFGAFGDDNSDRNLLGPIALQRAAARGIHATPQQTLIIGDTHRDIACAHAFGARVLAVATGHSTTTDLAAYQPDFLTESLATFDFSRLL